MQIQSDRKAPSVLPQRPISSKNQRTAPRRASTSAWLSCTDSPAKGRRLTGRHLVPDARDRILYWPVASSIKQNDARQCIAGPALKRQGAVQGHYCFYEPPSDAFSMLDYC
ncbi:hypothetical protein B0H17DRAFT_655296 [Mycena rosella]|uniref:Uncharacterized protein n=1 Tax=Mycena rosella TaxID=1033263 RepID=A0AAD7GCS2_MYCRO|nr:hypothetical protein B0H17DRAFT_655296 [Mycena rosella]